MTARSEQAGQAPGEQAEHTRHAGQPAGERIEQAGPVLDGPVLDEPVLDGPVLDGLARVCGDVRSGRPEEGVLGVAPSWVAAPADAAEAAALMRFAAEHGLTVVPRGAESRLDWGMPPARCDLLIDTWRLDRIIEHAAGDLVVKVEAGLTMAALAERLAQQGQQLALDTPLDGATVGGTLATAACGPRELLYGSARDLLIGVTVVRADGTIARSGGKVVKNVAGYDLGKLLTGSHGTLGLIVEAAFRLHPIPAARACVTTTAADPAAASRAVQAVLHSALVPAAIEIDAPAGGPVTIGVLVEGVAAGVAPRAEQAAGLLGGDAVIAAAPPPWWGRYPDGGTLLEITALPAVLPRLLAVLHGADAGGTVLRGSAGLGHWYAGVPVETTVEQVSTLVAELRAAAAAGHGHVVVRFAPENVRDKVDLWGPVPASALMRRVKDQFDPDHRLSPGRFAGGI